jgi:hypothetical protein
MPSTSKVNGISSKGNSRSSGANLRTTDLLQIEGDYDTFVGKVQERYGEKKDEVGRWTEQWLSSSKSKDNPDARKAS